MGQVAPRSSAGLNEWLVANVKRRPPAGISNLLDDAWGEPSCSEAADACQRIAGKWPMPERDRFERIARRPSILAAERNPVGCTSEASCTFFMVTTIGDVLWRMTPSAYAPYEYRQAVMIEFGFA